MLAGEAAQNHAPARRSASDHVPSDERAWGQGSEAAFAAHEAMFLVDALLEPGAGSAARRGRGRHRDGGEQRASHRLDRPSLGARRLDGYVHQPAILANFTVTLQLLKRGLKLEPGRSHAGDIEVVDIGIPQAVIEKRSRPC